jgi:hypothetical protein
MMVMKLYIGLRYFFCALVFGLALGSCASARGGGKDDFELMAENAGWYGTGALPEKYVTYLKSETTPLFSGKNSPALEFSVDMLDVLDEDEGGLLRRVLYGGLSCREYAEDLFDKVKGDYFNEAEPQSGAPRDWSYMEVFEGEVYPTVLVVSKKLYAYTGGAHGQNEKTFFVLDTKLGLQVFLNDILSSGAKALLQERIEETLREDYGLAPGASLRAAGFLEDSGGVPENFFLSSDGLGFCWNPYEIAPYAMGVIEIVLPYDHIEDLLSDGGRVLFKNL